MPEKSSIVVTSINAPNDVLRAIADGAIRAGMDFIVVGDTKSPPDFALEGCRFLSIDEQVSTDFSFAKLCPTRHYARKNIGYLLAAANGSQLIIETDDDNFPHPEFFGPRTRSVSARLVQQSGWINAYRYFTEADIWPRGLPLDRVHDRPAAFADLTQSTADCPIQQGLADENPDVDAIYRLLLPLPQSFRGDIVVALGRGAWCPFNSQNTTWWSDAFPLLYLPAYCSFRMTDIWRSFVAQRICWENGWSVLFHGPTVWQRRNEHDLMRDFADEVPGYLNNDRIRGTLEDLDLKGGDGALSGNLRICYRALVELGVVGKDELPLLDAWIADYEALK